ncbi:MAG: hypothetical protein JST67_00475 [Bacteroidetes bacterium]|nr:hypothetical protein [Bacteroidota bacterium]
MLDRIDFDAQFDQLPLPAQGSNREYDAKQLIKQFMTGIWCGVNRFEHCEVTRIDSNKADLGL